MRYLPQTPDEIKIMCEAIGVKTPHDLFHVIPEKLQLKSPLDLPKPLAEADLLAHLKALGRVNGNVDGMPSFLGGGAYHHYIPVAVSAITSRGEFLTSYTPYQPEISQGTLQAIFEFQTMIASLTGMELANASNYDGASALAEACLMAMRITKRSKILLAGSIHPQYRQVVRTYLSNRDCEVVEFSFNGTGRVETEALQKQLNEDVAAVCVQSPNFFGVVEKFQPIADAVHACGGLMVGCFSEALSLGMLTPMGKMGADIVVGEGQSFGNFLSLGGPYLGLFATREKFVRQMPGRLVGETVDVSGKRGYVLVLSTREQHIRREKATSNICTNQGLCALATATYLSLMGPKGLGRLAQTNYSHAVYLRQGLSRLAGVKRRFSAPHFNELVLQLPIDVGQALQALQKKNILGGISLGRWYPEMADCLLICATEMNSKEQMDQYIQAMGEIL
jgi:glycine cleavage system P protein (glycine dehydrogenase) subunit 1